MDQMQMRFLRLLSRSVSQNITYHCYNSRAWDDDGHTIKLQGDDEMELTASEKTKPVVVKNGCEVNTHVGGRKKIFYEPILGLIYSSIFSVGSIMTFSFPGVV